MTVQSRLRAAPQRCSDRGFSQPHRARWGWHDFCSSELE